MKWKSLRNNIPSHIRVHPRKVYEVVYTDSFKDPSILGETRFDNKQIALNLGQSDKELVSTYFHEFLHALSEAHKCDLTESQVKSLEKSLPYFLRFANILQKGKR